MIHPLAVVDETAGVGEGCRVWQFASVIRGARIGAGGNIASCAIVDGARLGAGCIVGHGASVHPGACLEDGVFVGPGAVICNDLWPRTDKTGFDIGRLLKGEVSVLIETGASIGANAVVLPGVRIGEGAMVSAGALVNRDVPANHLWTRGGELLPIHAVRRRMGFVAC